jgi:aminoglycoside phosphotransferase (APT) family kinase protein
VEIDPASARPRTSTRDREALRAALEGWLAQHVPGARITALAAPEGNGMSSETLLFDMAWEENGAAQSRRCVARLPPDLSAMPVFPVYDLAKQFRVMQIARERTGVPVPRMLWHEPDPSCLGAPFLVMERVDGEAPPDVPPYVFDSWLLHATPEQQRTLQDSALRTLAALHRMPLDAPEREYLRAGPGPGSALRRHVQAQREYYAWVSSDGIRQPVVERAFDWLEAHWPAEEGEEVLSWGDARIGNMLFRDFRPTAVLDWEMVATAPREVDLGWMIYLHHFFQDFTPFVGVPGIPTMMRLDEAAATYADASGHAPRDLGFYTLYAALRHAIVMARVGRRGVHFGEATMPADPDDLIFHRASIEAMMDGSYWESRR